MKLGSFLRQIKHVSEQDAKDIITKAKAQGRLPTDEEYDIIKANLDDAATADSDTAWLLDMMRE